MFLFLCFCLLLSFFISEFMCLCFSTLFGCLFVHSYYAQCLWFLCLGLVISVCLYLCVCLLFPVGLSFLLYLLLPSFIIYGSRCLSRLCDYLCLVFVIGFLRLFSYLFVFMYYLCFVMYLFSYVGNDVFLLFFIYVAIYFFMHYLYCLCALYLLVYLCLSSFLSVCTSFFYMLLAHSFVMSSFIYECVYVSCYVEYVFRIC